MSPFYFIIKERKVSRIYITISMLYKLKYDKENIRYIVEFSENSGGIIFFFSIEMAKILGLILSRKES